MGHENKMGTKGFLGCCTTRALKKYPWVPLWGVWWTVRMGIFSWNCPVVNLERGSEASAVFLLLCPDVTEAEFGSGYLSVMDEHYNLPGETETRRQSHPRTALGSWPISQICTVASKNNVFCLCCFSPSSRKNNLSPALILPHSSSAFSKPQLNLELATDGRKRHECCAWVMERGPFIGQSGQPLGNKLWWPFYLSSEEKLVWCWRAMGLLSYILVQYCLLHHSQESSLIHQNHQI